MARILIADRVPFMSNITRFALQVGGHEVVAEAANGIQAIEMYSVLEPDLVISEIVLPRINGISLLQKLKAIDPLARVIICSTVRKESMIEQALSFGADAYILKPFQIQNFLAEIRRVVGPEKAAAPGSGVELNQAELQEMVNKVLIKTITSEEIATFLRKANKK